MLLLKALGYSLVKLLLAYRGRCDSSLDIKVQGHGILSGDLWSNQSLELPYHPDIDEFLSSEQHKIFIVLHAVSPKPNAIWPEWML